MSRQPNILFAIADDASHFSVYGHPFVHTPNIEYVAQEGIVFENAFTINPKCAPSRACILTGMYTWQLEEACNHFSLFPSKFAVYPELLEQAGYIAGYTGKGWGPGDWRTGGFARNPAGAEFNEVKLTPPENTGIKPCDYAGNFERFLSERSQDKPFVFWYGCFEPHRPYKRGQGARAGKKPEDILHIPGYWPDDEVIRNDILDYAYEIEWFDDQLGRMLSKLEEIGELEHTIVVVTSDNGCPFPRVKGQMYEQDFHLPMVVMWREKCRGNRRVDDLISFADLAPTFLEAAGAPVHPQITGRSFMDILQADGSGLIDASRTTAYFGREKHDVGSKGDVGYPVRCIRNREYLYVRNFEPDRWPSGDPETWYTNCDGSPTKERVLELHAKGDNSYYQLCFGRRPSEELYQIVDDPECLNNLACLPEYAQLKERLQAELYSFLERTGDPRIHGNGHLFDQYPYVGKQLHSWKSYEEGEWRKPGH